MNTENNNVGFESNQNNINSDFISNENNYQYNDLNSSSIPTAKKSKKTPFVAIVAVIAVLASGAGVFAARNVIVNTFQKTFYSPEKYLQTVEKKSIEKRLKEFKDDYEYGLDLLNSDELSMNFSAEVSIEDTLMDMFAESIKDSIDELPEELSNIDIKRLKSMGAEYTLAKNGNVIGLEINGSVNSKEIASVNTGLNLKEKKWYAQIPLISNDYLDFSELFDEMDVSEEKINSIMSALSLEDVAEFLPESKKMVSLLERYSFIVIESLDDVEKESTEITANGVSQKCTALTVEIDGDTLYKILYNMLDSAADDDDLKEIVEDYYDYLCNLVVVSSSELPKLDMDESIDTLKDELEKIEDDFDRFDDMFEMVVYVSNSGKIIGREFLIGPGKDAVSLYYYQAISSNDFGYEAGIESNDETLVEITGEGDYNLKDFNGEFELSIPSEDLKIYAEVNNCKVADFIKGDFSGDITLSTNYDSLKDYKLKMSLDIKRDCFNIKLTGIENDKKYVSVAFGFTIQTKADKYVPSNLNNTVSITNEDDLKAYLEKFDIEKCINDIIDASKIIIPDDIKKQLIDELKSDYEEALSNPMDIDSLFEFNTLEDHFDTLEDQLDTNDDSDDWDDYDDSDDWDDYDDSDDWDDYDDSDDWDDYDDSNDWDDYDDSDDWDDYNDSDDWDDYNDSDDWDDFNEYETTQIISDEDIQF